MRFFPKGALVAIAAICLAWTAEAVPITYQATLSGPAEDPPNASPGIGSTLVTIDVAAHTLRVQASFADLIGPTIAAHIHGPTAIPFQGLAGVITMTPTFSDFPLGVTSGSFSRILDLTLAASFNPAFLLDNAFTPAEAELALADALDQGRAYLNIHTSEFPGGEIRGFLTVIPLPAALPLLLASLIVLGWAGSARRRA